MATKDKILGVLAAQDGAVSAKQLSDILGEPQANFYTQLARMLKDELVTQDSDKKWVIADAGRKYLEDEEDSANQPPDEILKASPQPMAVISEYQKFMQLGRQSGVINQSLLKATCDHVWAGDYHDLKSVHSALIQANIQPDLANRWVAFWSSYLKLTITPEIEQIMSGTKTEKGVGSVEGKTLRQELTHIINPDTGLPLYVGSGNGDYTYADAKDLSSQFLASRARGGPAGAGGAQQQSNRDPFEIAKDIFNMIKQKEGENPAPGKNYMVKPGPDGELQVEEMDSNKPMVIQSKAMVPVPPGGELNQFSAIRKLIEDLTAMGLVRPVNAAAGAGGQAIKYIYVDNEGKEVEAVPGRPIVIYKDRPHSSSNLTLPTEDGKGITINVDQLETFFKLEDWKDKRRREQESHESHQELIKTAKDGLGKLVKAGQNWAASHGSEGGGEGEQQT